MRLKLVIPLCIAIALGSCTSHKESDDNRLILRFDRPAQSWMTERLPVGNGYMGVMFMGDPAVEHIQFAEESLWAGGPNSGTQYDFGIKKGASDYLPRIRELLRKGDTQGAYALTEKWMTGIIHPRENLDFGDYGAHQTMGDLFVSMEMADTIYDYRRELDLTTGTGSVTFRHGMVSHRRSFFGCYPYRNMVYNFTNSSSTGCDYHVELQTPHVVDSIFYRDSTLSCYGHLADNNQAFVTAFIIETDGNVQFVNNKLLIGQASNLIIKHLAFTDYAPCYPKYHNPQWHPQALDAIERVRSLTLQQLTNVHLADYRALFNRVELNICGPSLHNMPLDKRLARYANGEQDAGLEELYFQFGRYLMISGSRPGTLPLNLQGKWNNSTNPPWACDYHTNINLQMLYWPAEVCNLPECHLPLMDFMHSLKEPGQRVASEFFGARGWVANTMCNAYGYTAPGWALPWGFFPAGAAWLCRHAWEHFEFTHDTTFLKETAFPLMQSAAQFWMDYLIENEEGYLVSMPSFSPEHGGISSGAAMDHQIARDLFNSCALAAKALQLDSSVTLQYDDFSNRIAPDRIGKWGQLQEWIEDIDNPDDKHRHISHLFALHPDGQIDPINTPLLAEAALTSLKARGDGGTGWSLAWKANFYARLHKGDEAYQLVRRLLRPVETTSIDLVNGGSYFNLLCAHPPFQLDGNMGGIAAMAEMLVQSNNGVIHFLPAIPENWKKGSAKGLKTRGNFEVDFNWDNRKLTYGTIKGTPGSKGEYRIGLEVYPFTIPPSGRVTVIAEK